MNSNRKVHTLLAFVIVVLLAALPLTALATAEEDANKELAVLWVQDFMVTGDLSVAKEMASPGFVAHEFAETDLDLNAFKARIDSILGGSVDIASTVELAIASQDIVALQMTQEGLYVGESWVNTVSEAWEVTTILVLRFESGKVAEVWGNFDRWADLAYPD